MKITTRTKVTSVVAFLIILVFICTWLTDSNLGEYLKYRMANPRGRVYFSGYLYHLPPSWFVESSTPNEILLDHVSLLGVKSSLSLNSKSELNANCDQACIDAWLKMLSRNTDPPWVHSTLNGNLGAVACITRHTSSRADVFCGSPVRRYRASYSGTIEVSYDAFYILTSAERLNK
jgi:hypothetical protein